MHQLLLVATAAAKDPPILDLDSTVFLQLGVFVITAIVLSRLLFKPYLAVKAARDAGMVGAKDQARALEAEADRRMAEYQQAFNQARSKANSERAKLQAEAVARERLIVDVARQATQASLDKARKEIDDKATAARQQLGPRATELAHAMVEKILGRKVA